MQKHPHIDDRKEKNVLEKASTVTIFTTHGKGGAYSATFAQIMTAVLIESKLRRTNFKATADGFMSFESAIVHQLSGIPKFPTGPTLKNAIQLDLFDNTKHMVLHKICLVLYQVTQ